MSKHLLFVLFILYSLICNAQDSFSDEKVLVSDEFITLLNQVSTRAELKDLLNQEIIQLEQKEKDLETEIDNISDELKRLKEEYAILLRFSYKHKNPYQKLIFILSAIDINQAYKRYKYIQLISDYRREQGVKISHKQDYLNELKEKVQLQKQFRLDVLNQLSENSDTGENESLPVDMIDNLKQNYEKTRSLINSKHFAEYDENTVNKNEITGKSAKLQRKLPMALLVKARLFEAQKGKLPWPVKNGFITSRFGEHQHPTLTNVTIRKDGIEISAPLNSDVCSVYDGEVSKIVNIPGSCKAVLIKNGIYYFLYSNITQIKVKVNQKVKAGVVLGLLCVSKTNTKMGALDFQIWKEKIKLNPAKWLEK